MLCKYRNMQIKLASGHRVNVRRGSDSESNVYSDTVNNKLF